MTITAIYIKTIITGSQIIMLSFEMRILDNPIEEIGILIYVFSQ